MQNRNIDLIFLLLLFRDPEPFDWYQRYNGLKEVITPNISQNSQILNVGCGNSSKKLLNFLYMYNYHYSKD